MAKPDPRTAMQNLISEIRNTLPFDMPVAELCSGICRGCSKKLLDYLDMELAEWEDRLAAGDIPSLGDINQLASSSQKIYKVLQRNGLV